MGRELKRVPLNFEWPINKLWCGYINPHKVHKCKHCDGSGESEDYRKLESKWYNWENEDRQPNPFKHGYSYNANAWCHNLSQFDVDALIKADRLWDFTRIPINDEQKEIVKAKIEGGSNCWLPSSNGYTPTAKEVNEWSLKGIGHDAVNRWVCIKARLKVEKKSSKCPYCKGTGENWQHPKAKRLYNSWKPFNPPKGEGFQLWTTTSEGSPMTPVFSSLEDLCIFCEDQCVSVFGSSTATKERWMQMLSDDFIVHQEGNMIFI